MHIYINAFLGSKQFYRCIYTVCTVGYEGDGLSIGTQLKSGSGGTEPNCSYSLIGGVRRLLVVSTAIRNTHFSHKMQGIISTLRPAGRVANRLYKNGFTYAKLWKILPKNLYKLGSLQARQSVKQKSIHTTFFFKDPSSHTVNFQRPNTGL